LTLENNFPAIIKAVRKLKLRSTILDGEIVALDNNGIPRFQLLQKWQKQPTAPIAYYVFDLLWSEGKDLTSKTVLDRRPRPRLDPWQVESSWPKFCRGMDSAYVGTGMILLLQGARESEFDRG
jgi:ATP dependent DNA ligase domain